MRSIKEIKKIIRICKENNIPITGSLFQTNPDNLEKIIMLCQKNNIKLSNAMLFRSAEEVELIINICDQYGLEYQDGIFKRTPDEILKIIEVCRNNDIPITSNVFRRKYNEFIEIIEVCNKLGLDIKGTIFKRNAQEIEEIYNINMELLGEKPSPNTFNKKPDEVRKILELCQKNNIKVTGTIYRRRADELEETINYVKDTFGPEYLIPQIIIEDKNHLQVVLNYFLGKGLLSVIINSPSILRLTITEIVDRENFISNCNQELITSDGKFNPVFGWSRKLYEKKKKELEERKTLK